MDEQEKKDWISVGMEAAYSDLVDKLATKIGTFHKAKRVFPQHAEYYDTLVELYEEEFNYCREMSQIGRQMRGETIQ